MTFCVVFVNKTNFGVKISIFLRFFFCLGHKNDSFHETLPEHKKCGDTEADNWYFEICFLGKETICTRDRK
jgi:hypothetical protein